MTTKDFVVHEERQGMPTWAALLMWAACLGVAVPLLLEGLGGRAGSLAGGAALAALPLLIRALVGSLTIRITRTSVAAMLGTLGLFGTVIPFADIRALEAVRYRPLREFGGWGWRRGSGGRTAWTMSGNQALVVHRTNGERVYLGSDHPERLRVRIEGAAGTRFESPAGGGRAGDAAR